uniref:Uncharacterized protein n=1 Tax=Meloidogyne javanica TaxID=6303 RepID=A0A915LXZ3_MELJA
MNGQQQHKTTTFSNACESSLVKNEGELNTAFALNLALNNNLLPLIQELINRSNGEKQGNSVVNQSEQQQLLLAASASNNMKNDTTEARRADIIQEADQILQTIVQQMIRTRDLVSYLRRLRQFLSDNFVE